MEDKIRKIMDESTDYQTGEVDAEIAISKLLDLFSVSGSSSDEPENCPKEYNEDVCDGCEFREYEMVSHPGGCSYVSVEKAKCGWGHWEDDF